MTTLDDLYRMGYHSLEHYQQARRDATQLAYHGDPLAPFKGILFGLFASALLWVPIVGVIAWWLK